MPYIGDFSIQRNLLHILVPILIYSRKEQIPINQRVTLAEINSLIKHYKNSRVLKRFYFVKSKFLGDFIEEAVAKVGVIKTGYY